MFSANESPLCALLEYTSYVLGPSVYLDGNPKSVLDDPYCAAQHGVNASTLSFHY